MDGDYQIGEVYKIRQAAGRPVALSFWAVVIGLILAALFHTAETSCVIGLAVVLVGVGSFCFIVYSINLLTVTAWTKDMEARHEAIRKGRGQQ